MPTSTWLAPIARLPRLCSEAQHAPPPSIWVTFAALSLAAGCVPGIGPIVEPPWDEPSSSALIEAEAATHHFGTVISRPGKVLTHRYRLANTSARPIRFLGVENRKPCCGTIAPVEPELAPGESQDVAVELSVAREFGDVVHETLITTDTPGAEPILLRTIAQVVPPLRIESTDPGPVPTLITGSAPRELEFQVVANGTQDDPSIDLNRLELAGSTPARWLDPQETTSVGDGLTILTRRLVLTLAADPPAGPKAATLLLRDGPTSVLEHALHFEVVSPVTCHPRMLVLGAGKGPQRLLLTAADSSAFRIERIELGSQSITYQDEPSNEGRVHRLRLDLDTIPRPEQGNATVTVRLNHPEHTRLEIPVLWIDVEKGDPR